eukprot:CAMPEP_0194026120 /NCGR_PEP_ID=MMETSP0009_2-20130614/435_1 /TAXON_ID=210454 /ORGANISM="Grammatophora oceanica, Strain CCMP 410" /LENGTH=203 /DNA_ID=CAMNT_0038664659 /DNA_START=472 /DNA_END=1083 /DNA_ORIENTATION=-
MHVEKEMLDDSEVKMAEATEAMHEAADLFMMDSYRRLGGVVHHHGGGMTDELPRPPPHDHGYIYDVHHRALDFICPVLDALSSNARLCCPGAETPIEIDGSFRGSCSCFINYRGDACPDGSPLFADPFNCDSGSCKVYFYTGSIMNTLPPSLQEAALCPATTTPPVTPALITPAPITPAPILGPGYKGKKKGQNKDNEGGLRL